MKGGSEVKLFLFWVLGQFERFHWRSLLSLGLSPSLRLNRLAGAGGRSAIHLVRRAPNFGVPPVHIIW